MKRRHFLGAAGAAGALLQANPAPAQTAPAPVEIYPGVWKFSFGKAEEITPVRTRRYPPAESALKELTTVAACPVPVRGSGSRRGYLVRIPLVPNEIVYGLGLQLQSVIQRGLKKKLRVNADPKMDTGDSHAPVPFYVTTSGYGVLVDTARYATFYCGNKKRTGEGGQTADQGSAAGPDVLPAAYRSYRVNEASEVLIEIPVAEGVDVYVFGGPTLREAVQRYNLFSGGGSLPPRWGLGMWYRAKSDYQQAELIALADEFRERRIPCDVIGLEPGWQTHSYSCSYVWSTNYPKPEEMLAELTKRDYRVNLWEHAFTHPTSPIYEALRNHSGDYEVWDGLVPDFLQGEARRIFGDYHERTLIAPGVSGFKLDECDNSDFTGNWSFPEIARFPSGADGEQMHCLFGLRYQDTFQDVFEKRGYRTYGLVRNSGALAAPYPYVLYSDLYDHREFIRGLVTAGFSGLLWTPELRDAKDPEDLVRRLQSVVLSPMALINAWYIKNPPWKQVARWANNDGHLAPGWEEIEAKCRGVMELRMRLIPYLHAAFVEYHRRGLPPFRALAMDYPQDPAALPIDDQYLMGASILVAPAFAGEASRSVYLPEGEWFDFWNGQRYAGKQRIEVRPPLEQIPMFVKSGTILPLAEATRSTADVESRHIEARVYGTSPAPALLYEDDGSAPPALGELRLTWDDARGSGSVERGGTTSKTRYEVTAWKPVASRG
jgi:alpha-D-xyloside xylohydrolase